MKRKISERIDMFSIFEVPLQIALKIEAEIFATVHDYSVKLGDVVGPYIGDQYLLMPAEAEKV